ncbi:uncharacterized protein LOC105684409 isoform X2 [Athalia rosae]|uniref:uncharacterized protein LOC105684409 isoform X2 n=1 Tax=Athalia rosae TaxID=37344 RepID=UPI0020338FA7|nr:uncharacterized protein LOC105684409 isoform X2 [Athalia rosae]
MNHFYNESCGLCFSRNNYVSYTHIRIIITKNLGRRSSISRTCNDCVIITYIYVQHLDRRVGITLQRHASRNETRKVQRLTPASFQLLPPRLWGPSCNPNVYGAQARFTIFLRNLTTQEIDSSTDSLNRTSANTTTSHPPMSISSPLTGSVFTFTSFQFRHYL